MSPRLPARLLLSVGLGLLCAVAFAATAPTRLAAGTVHLPLYDIAFDGAHGVAVGAGGQVLVSGDAGQNWRAEKPLGPSSLLGIAVRGGHSIAVGQSGLVMLRTGDADWRRVKVDTSERLMGIAMNSRGLAVVVGSFGTILESADFGETWIKTAADWPAIFAANLDTLGPAFAPHLYGVDVSESGEIRIVGELSLILASTGLAHGTASDWRVLKHGQIVNGEADPSLFGVRMRADGGGYAVGQAGRAFRTADGGRTWTALEVGSGAILLAAEVAGSKRVLLTGIREMLLSDDDGEHWQRIAAPDVVNDWYVAAAKPDESGAVFVVGSSGKILKIPD
ncbi:MAG: hypothetical protein NVS9B10_08460 [Nevskia sp.]